ncbi:Coagulation Factor Viii [Manis pentadactyla]|nr:Coagulation Factor Viii [Manis pentadactyla]
MWSQGLVGYRILGVWANTIIHKEINFTPSISVVNFCSCSGKPEQILMAKGFDSPIWSWAGLQNSRLQWMHYRPQLHQTLNMVSFSRREMPP